MWVLEDEWFSLVQEIQAAGVTKAQFEEFLQHAQKRRSVKDLDASDADEMNDRDGADVHFDVDVVSDGTLPNLGEPRNKNRKKFT